MKSSLFDDRGNAPEFLCRGCSRSLKTNDTILMLVKQRSRDLTHSDGAVSIKQANRLVDQISSVLNSKQYELLCGLEIESPTFAYNWNKLELYHLDCLICFMCGEHLTQLNKRCWKSRDLGVVCSGCRTRLTHCAQCRLRVAHDEWVHKLNQIPFHISCLICTHCNRQLRHGDKCGLIEGRLYCYDHYLDRTGPIPGREKSNREESDWSDPNENAGGGVGGGEGGRIGDGAQGKELPIPRNDSKEICGKWLNDEPDSSSTKAKIEHSISSSSTPLRAQNSDENPLVSSSYQRANSLPTPASSLPKADSNGVTEQWFTMDDLTITNEAPVSTNGDCSLPVAENGHSVDSSTSSGCSNHSKTKRIRTSFTPDQLAILQANFDIEANPDGQELERIANVARLNKRVTQVWFQNARARKKKIECKGSMSCISTGSAQFYLQDNSTPEECFDITDENILNARDSVQLCDPTGLMSYDPPLPFKPCGPVLFENRNHNCEEKLYNARAAPATQSSPFPSPWTASNEDLNRTILQSEYPSLMQIPKFALDEVLSSVYVSSTAGPCRRNQ
ncbi:unnamed protein product [Calicophoron daubneyi]|uniref:Uncharacterized protein n=1 Tax=Calicophoron daubneyi TaxID=300641 RepID=A0AAV2TZW6_CALDB